MRVPPVPYDALMKASNIIMCGPEFTYKAIQTAITAAVAAYSSDNVWRVVMPSPYTVYDEDVVVPTGVILRAIIPNTSICHSLQSSGGVIDMYTRPVPQRPTVVYDPSMTLIAYQSNDAATEWVTTSDTLGGDSPAFYCAKNGIPVTHAVIGSSLDGTLRLSPNSLRTMMYMGGCELASHSQNHSAVTLATAMDEIISQKAYLESLTGTFTNVGGGFTNWDHYGTDSATQPLIQRLGAICRLFVHPGYWNSDDPTEMSTINTDIWMGYIGDCIRSTYEHFWGYGSINGGLQLGDNITYAGWQDIISIKGTAAMTAWLAKLAPGSRIVLQGDAPTNSMTMAEWKECMDALATAQQSGSVLLVSNTILRSAILRPSASQITIPAGVGTVTVNVWNSVLHDPTFETTAEGTLPTSATTTGSGWYSDGASIVDSGGSHLARITSGKFLQQSVSLPDGFKRCKIRIVANNTTADEAHIATLRIGIRTGWRIAGSGVTLRFWLPDIVLTDTAATHYRTFAVSNLCREFIFEVRSLTNGSDILSCEAELG